MALVLGVSAATGAVDISSCDQVVDANDTARLAADLICDGASFGVALGGNATLDVDGGTGVVELSNCDVGVVSRGQKVRLRAAGLRVHDVRVGVFARSIRGHDITVTSCTGIPAGINGAGIAVRKAQLTNTSINGCWTGLQVEKSVRGSNITSSDNYVYGVFTSAVVGGSVELTNLMATGNGFAGVQGSKVRLADSTVTGNGVVIGETGADLSTSRLPILTNTACDKSVEYGTTNTWGVCAND
jgi:hypothetical protein